MIMKLFGSNPRKKLEKELRKKLEEAAEAQRAGKIPVFAVLSSEAEELQKQLDALDD
ncbi:MAG: DUF6435 family protein [Acidobacteriota bacterium]